MIRNWSMCSRPVTGSGPIMGSGLQNSELKNQEVPPEPRLQGAPGHENSPAIDIEKFRAQETQSLNSYGWVDSKAGVVRIPIEDAKKLLLQRGLPVREQAGESRKQKAEGRHQ